MRALVVVDMINDFVHPEGVLFVPAAKDIIPAVKVYIEKARGEGLPVIYVCDAHRKGDRELQDWGEHAMEGSWGAQVVDELKPEEGDIIIGKHTYSAFYNTELEQILRKLDVDEVMVTGTVTDICVYHTVADAYFRGFKIVVPRDGVAALDEEHQEFALQQMERLFKASII